MRKELLAELPHERKHTKNVLPSKKGSGHLIGICGHCLSVQGWVLERFSLYWKICHQEFQVPETSEKVWSKKDLPLVEEDQNREPLNKLYRPWNLG